MKFRLFSGVVAIVLALAISPAVAAVTWTPYSAPLDGFTASFPGSPTIATPKNAATVDGIYRTYSVDRTTSAYFISAFRYKPGAAPSANVATYRTLRDAYAKGSTCTVTSSRSLSLVAVPALESVCIDKKAKLEHLLDVLITGDFLYIVVSAGPIGFAKTPSAKTFRDGFALQPVATPAPPAAASPSPEPTPST